MRPVSTIMVFIIVAALFNIYDHSDEWSWSKFLAGVACGLPVLPCHFINRIVGLSFFGFSFLALMLVSAGVVNAVEINQLFFAGMSIGVIMGWVPALLLDRAKALKFLAQSAKIDGYGSLAERIESKFR